MNKWHGHYVKGGNEGSVVEMSYNNKTVFIAVCSSTSKNFKTLKGADKWLKNMGYSLKVA